MANCPHCEKDLGPNFVPKEEHLKRLKAKEDENDRLQTEAAKGALVAGLTDEVKAAQAKAAAAEQGLARFKAIVGKGAAIGNPKLADPKVAAAVEAIHASEMAGLPEAQRVPYETWLDASAKDHPALGHLFQAAPAPAGQPAPQGAQPQTPPAPGTPAAQGAQPAAPPTPAAPAAQPAPGAPPAAPRGPGLPPANLGAAPDQPARQGPMTASQIATYFASDEYRALPKEQREAKRRELQQQAKAPTTARV